MTLQVNFYTTANAITTPQLGRIVMGLDKPNPSYGVYPGNDNWRAKHNEQPKVKVKRGLVDHYG